MSRRHRRTRGSVAGLVVGNECLLMLYSLARCEQRGRAVRSWWTRKLSSLSAIHHLPTARTGCLAVGSCSEGLLRALQLASARPRCGMARPSSTSFDWPGPRPHKPALSLAWRRLVARDCYRSQTRPARRSLTSRLLMRDSWRDWVRVMGTPSTGLMPCACLPRRVLYMRTSARTPNLTKSKGKNHTMFQICRERERERKRRRVSPGRERRGGDRGGEGRTHPDDADPAARDAADLGEAPVAVGGDDRRDELGEAERQEEGDRGALHEEEAVRPGDEDEGLRDLGDPASEEERERASVQGLVRTRGRGRRTDWR